MKNKSVYKRLKLQVDNVLEIRLPYLTWNKIKWVAMNKNLTYSWVVRCAVFRMIKRGDIKNYIEGGVSEKSIKKITRLNELVLAEKVDSINKHRHRLCLYGEDELYIRLSAARLGCTMTHLVRLALALYLDDWVRKFPVFGRAIGTTGVFTRAAWRCLGIKVFRVAKFPNIVPSGQHFDFIRYKNSDYW